MAPIDGGRVETDVVDTIPKTMQAKARRLMEGRKRHIAWTERGELILEDVPIVGSNEESKSMRTPLHRRRSLVGWEAY